MNLKHLRTSWPMTHLRSSLPLSIALISFCLLVVASFVGSQVNAQEGNLSPSGDSSLNDDSPPTPVKTQGQTPKEVARPTPQTMYDLWVIAPAVVAIVLAIFTRQVIPALVVGVLVGAFMYAPCLSTTGALAGAHPVIRGTRLAFEQYVIGALHEPLGENFAHIKIIIFTLTIGFTVGVIGRNGGTAGLVNLFTGNTQSKRRGALTAWFAGLVVFFDDYANSMIVGPTMRPVFDRLKLSRAKLAYIVDSTAAPVASIALIGTWIGTEIGFIQGGINSLGDGNIPEFLRHADGRIISGMEAFINSLAYRFYPILALVLVFLIALTSRDFGPMRRSERKAMDRDHHQADRASPVNPHNQHDPYGQEEYANAKQITPKPWLGVWPILMLVGITITILIYMGYTSPDTVKAMYAVDESNQSTWSALPLWEQASIIVRNSDSYIAIFYGAILAAFVAVVTTMLWGVCRTKDAVEAGLSGMANMFPAVVILILAWALSAVLKDLQLGQIVSERIKLAEFPVRWLPVSVFATAAAISFATGTSWGTMGILCPATVTIAAKLCGTLEATEALSLFYASIGSVLAGAIFGDHCSPISDTTVLSSIASGCPHEEHVWTQLPYALVTAIVAMGVGDVLCSRYSQPWYIGFTAGTAVLLIVVFVFGRKTEQPAPPPIEDTPLPV